MSLISSFVASTTQNPTLDDFDYNAAATGTWTFRSYSYWPTKSGSLTLKFNFITSANYDWYLDDVSVQDSASSEKLTNGDFESGLSSWSVGSTFGCLTSPGISTTRSHSSSHSFRDSCDSIHISISQSFVVTDGERFNVSFWYYLDKVASWWIVETVDVEVTIT